MQLTATHSDEFAQRGFTVIDNVFTAAEMAGAEAALERLHADTPRFISMLRDPDLLFLGHDPRLERIAKHLLHADDVVHVNNTSLYKSPGDEGPWKQGGEHVDIMYSLDELDAKPIRMTCILMVLVADLPEGRANTFVRPGSHRMMAQYLREVGLEPVKAQPTQLKNLPELNWPDPVPIVGKAGQVIATTTSLVHSGSTNITDKPRQLVFTNFCPAGMLRDVGGNHDRWPEREAYRTDLRRLFPEDRRYLLEGSYFDAPGAQSA